MYVCICNAVSEGDVHTCVAAGACTVRQVKKACGWKPGCGSCTTRLAEVISRARLTEALQVSEVSESSAA
ncbi:(2Fe-2S)-binding protein [Nocardia sp. NBC_01377]|uniref:(2Fe-2S)-binding protein n=1 Tax=Nocardia sp. NBC_01377 TaxID=2903595 RepID=UPI003254C323